jgi:transposase
MQLEDHHMHIASIGIDLGKTTFHFVALDEHGKIVIKKRFSRKQLLTYTANLLNSRVGMEACAGAHFIGAAKSTETSRVGTRTCRLIVPSRLLKVNVVLAI